MSNVSQKILQLIKDKQIQPKSRWYFLSVHVLMWSAVAGAIVVGSLACGVLIHHFRLTDWGMVRQLSDHPVKSIMIVLPYVWFLLLIIILYLAKWLFSHTQKGYKIRPSLVIVMSIVISMAGGLLTFSYKLDVPFERSFRNHVPFYKFYIKERSRHFVNPSKGVLAGEIIEVKAKETLLINDLREERWTVDIQNILYIPDFIILKKGMPIGILGKKTAPYLFEAEKILAPPPFLMRDLKNERSF